MEVVIRTYLYKNYDFLNKPLNLDHNLKSATNEWRLNNNIYANLVDAKIELFNGDLNIIKIHKEIRRISFENFDRLTKNLVAGAAIHITDDAESTFYTYAIYKEKKCPKYKFNKIWKGL